MKAINQVSYVLELTREEVEWLKDRVQNPLYSIPNFEEKEELPEDKQMRETFWNTLCEFML